MAQTRGTWVELTDNVEKVIYTVMAQQLKELKPIWREIYNVKTSDRKFDRVHTMVPFGDIPEKAEGAPYTTDLLRPGYTKDFTHTEFGLGFEYTQTAMEDDQYSMLVQGAKWLAFSMRYVQEKRAANPFNNGFSTETTPDGLSFFNTAHLLKGGGTSRNRPATDADLSVTSLTDVMTDLQTQTKDEAGHLAMPVRGLTLYIPPALEFLAAKIIESQLEALTADNNLNTLRTRRTWRLVVNPHLSDADAWFVGATDKGQHGLCTYVRVAPRVMPVEKDPKTGNLLITSRFRQSWGPWAWQGWYGTSGA